MCHPSSRSHSCSSHRNVDLELARRSRREDGLGVPSIWRSPSEADFQLVIAFWRAVLADHFDLGSGAGLHESEDGVDSVVLVIAGLELEGEADLWENKN